MRKIIALGIMLLFIGMTISATGFNLEKQSSITTLGGNTLYVGGNGTGNYTKIQDAIDNASDGDTVFVYSGTYYETNIIVDKSISLIGENKNSTVIDGGHWKYDVIYVIADGVIIQGFTVKDCGNTGSYGHYSAINVNSSYTQIYDNIIDVCDVVAGRGIRVVSDNNYVADNYIVGSAENDSTKAIYLGDQHPPIYANNNTVVNNTINEINVYIRGSFNIFSYNTLINPHIGVWFLGGLYCYDTNNTISFNTVVYNEEYAETAYAGILVYSTKNSSIYGNFISILAPNNLLAWMPAGLWLNVCYNMNVYQNTISNFEYGIWGAGVYNCTVYENNIPNCIYGIIFEEEPEPPMSRTFAIDDKPNYVRRNNFLRVLFPARNLFRSPKLFRISYWEENYWNRPRTLPKAIIGFIKISPILQAWGIPARLQFDWHPAQEPYDIPTIEI